VPIENVSGKYLPRVPGRPHAKTEAPDNYPSYGDKLAGKDAAADTVSLCSGEKPPAAEEKKETQGAEAKTEAPDNYPSYGDKGKKEETPPKKALASIILTDANEPSDYYLAKAPDNYPSYGDK
jgi:hypothetical protein